MRKRTLFLIYLLLSSYLNMGFVGFSPLVSAQENMVFQDDFNDNSLDTDKWTEDVVGSGNSYTEANGEAQFITYGHQGIENGHAFLRSSMIPINNWSYVIFSGSWKFTDPGTAEMWFRIYDTDSGNYIGVRYVSWPADKITYDRPEGSITNYRAIPRDYVTFKVVLYKDHFEYWEGGSLVKTVPTTGLENATNFQLVIGGWDYSSIYSHMYFDNIAVEYEPALPEEPLKVTIISPEEKVYDTSVIDLNVTANKPVDEWRYSLNGGENVTFTPNTTITAQNGENLLVVYALAGDERGMAQVNFYVNASEEDTIPPGTVRNLTHEVGADYIHWTWENPEDEDFETALIYIDGKFEGETDEGEWWLDELSPGETHTIGILTRDYSGNVNTTWVNDTATTLTPAETVYVNESGWWYEGGELNPSETPLQDGIDGAVKGGTVIVLAGTYPESVEVDKPLTVETSENARVTGDGSEWENGKMPVFYVSSDNVTLRGFEIDSSVSNIGVWLDDVGNCTVENNNIIIREAGESERYGIYLSYGGNHVVRNNDVSVSGFQGVGIYVYETDGESDVYGNTVVTEGDSADGIEVFYSSARIYDNTVSINGVGETPGYALYLYLAEDSSIDNNGLMTNLSEENAWAINVIGEFKGSLSGNRINGVQTEIVCPENCLLRGVSPEKRPAPPEGYGDVGEYLEIDADSWLHLGLYYDDSSLGGLREDTLQIWRFSEGWTLDGTSGHSLDTSKNLVEANLTQFSIFAPLAQEENDVTPPVLTFVEPTPENGALIGYSHVVINVTSNENLSEALIEFDGANHTMLGSGRNWHYEADVSDGIHTFKAYGTDLAGNNGTSEGRSFEVDTKAPEYSDVGQDKAGIPPGEELHVHAFWSDPHLSYARLVTNATEGGAWDWIDDTFFEGSEGWSNFTISTEGLDPGLYCWFIEASDSLEHWNSTPTECFRLYEPPEIVSHSPESPVESYVGDTVTFSITASQVVNVTWYLDGSPVKTEQNVETSTYTNSDAGEGEHGVRAAVENANGSASQFWAWYVYPRPGLTVSFVGPTPENGARLNVRTVVINVTSSLDLESATLEWNGVNESMSGSGRSWWATKEDLADGTYTFRVYGSADGVSNATEERTIEIDATAPGVIEYGQSSDEVLEGESIEVFARWSDAHLDGAVLVTNATFVDGAFVWSEVPLEIAGGWSNWSINTDENFAGKVFCWYIRANDTFGNENETPELCFRVGERLRIISFSPESSEVELPHNGTAVFSVELNQIANVTWFVNGTEVFEETGNESTYTNSTLIPGLWNVSVIAGNGNGLARHWWLMRVRRPEAPLGIFITSPGNGSRVKGNHVEVKAEATRELSTAVLELDGVNHTMLGSGKSWSLNISLTDGHHILRAYGMDEHGDMARSEEVVFDSDGKPPEITVNCPEEVDEGTSVTVEVMINDVHPDSYRVYLDGALQEEGEYSSNATLRMVFQASEPGIVEYRIWANDTFGWESEKTGEIRVRDKTPPALSLLPPTPENGSILNESAVVFRLLSNENLSQALLYLNGTAYEMNGSGRNWSLSMTLEDGKYSFYIEASDLEGNTNETEHRTFRIDTTPPALWFVQPTPENGSLINTCTFTVTINASEPLGSAILEIDRRNFTMSGSGRLWSYTGELCSSDGEYSFMVYGTDLGGNRGTSGRRTIAVDSTPPLIEWVHGRNMSPIAPGTFEVERLSRASIEVNATDEHPLVYEVYRNPLPNLLEPPVWRGSYESGVPFGFPVKTREVGDDVYLIVVRDRAGNEAKLRYTVHVIDTTPPDPVDNLTVSTNSSGFTVKWRNPINDDFERVELYLDPKEIEGNKGEKIINWDSSLIANLTGDPGGEMKFSMNLAHGRHVLYVRTFDRYGNTGKPVSIAFTVPLPNFVIYYVKPTPENGTILDSGVSEVTVVVASSVSLRGCWITWNGASLPGGVSKNICRARFNVIPGGEYSFSVSATDVYGRTAKTTVRRFSVKRECLEDGSSLTIDSTGKQDSLLFPVEFTFITNSLARKYSYRASVRGESVNGTFKPRFEVVGFKEVKDLLGGKVKKLYVVRGFFTLDLWEIRDAVLKGADEKIPVHLEVRATDDCARSLTAEKELTVCENPEKPDLSVNLKDFYYRDEEVIMSAEVTNGVPVREFYYSINGGPWKKFNGSVNLTGLLRPGENTVSVMAVSGCGIETRRKVSVFLGPPSDGDWLVNDTEECIGHEFTVNGGLAVDETGNLTLRGCKVHLRGGVGVNGSLRVLEGSLIGNASGLWGDSGKLEVEDSTFEGGKVGSFVDGTVRVKRALLAGEFAFEISEVSIDSSRIEGGLFAGGSFDITNTLVTGGGGIAIGDVSEGRIENVTVRDCTYGIHLINDNGRNAVFRNVLVENPREAGIFIDLRGGYWSGEAVFTNLSVVGGNVVVNGGSATFDRSKIEPGEGYAVLVDSAGKILTFKNSSVGGKGFLIRKLSTLSLQDSNLSGDIRGSVGYTEVLVSPGARASLKEGAADEVSCDVRGVLSVVSYTLNRGSITVYGGGTLRVEDEDGIPATDPADGDASVLKGVLIQETSGEEKAHLIFLNSRLQNGSIVTDSRWFLIRGSVIDGELSFNTGDESLSGGLSGEVAFGSNAGWYYSTNTLPENWYYSRDVEGMSQGTGPFVARSSTAPLGWNSGTELGTFTLLYLKRTFSVEELPVRAILSYSAVGRVEVYVNGRMAVNDGRVGDVSFTGSGIHGKPHSGSVDVAPYLLPGDNLITVLVKVPSNHPYSNYLYPKLGAFRASLTLESGLASVTDSVLNGKVSGYGSRVMFARDEINTGMSFGYLSRVTVSDSRIHGTLQAVGRIELINSELIGQGSGTGLKMTDYGMVKVENSRIHGFDCGIVATSEVNVTGSEVYDNDVGIRLKSARIMVKDSYVMNNGVGIETSNVTGWIDNSVIYGNNIGIRVNAGGDAHTRGNQLSITHETIVGNSLGVLFEGRGGSGYVELTKSLVQNNDLGLLINSTPTPGIRSDSLVNERDVLVEGPSAQMLFNIDWGGEEPEMVQSYPEGLMYTRDGTVREDYDILARNWKPVVYNSTETGEDWGSSLLSAFLEVIPVENGSVKGVITLAGKAVSRDGISKVTYSLERNGSVETLAEVSVGSTTYDDYILVDTLGMNLTGPGVLRFTATDSTGKNLTSSVRVYFANAEVVLENVSVKNATNIYSLYTVKYDDYTEGPHDFALNWDRMACVTVSLRNIGLMNGTARVVLELPEYIERHTGKVEGIAYLPPNGSLNLEFVIPVVEYDWGTMTWDVLPDELPDLGRFTVRVKLYDEDNLLRADVPVRVGFTLGPVFEITQYIMYPYSRAYCESSPNDCHNTPPYDGDGDDTVEAAESHHFDLRYENIGDRDAEVLMIDLTDHIPERYPGEKILRGQSAYIFPNSSALADTDPGSFNLLGSAPVGVEKSGMDLFIDWWADVPPVIIPPVNFSGNYLTNAMFYYRSEDGKTYYTPSLNYKERPVKALNKTFVVQNVRMDPIDVKVLAVKNGKTYVELHNTNGNVYYDYFVQGSYGPGEGYLWYHFIPPDFTMRAIADNSLEPNRTIPHYRIVVGAMPSMTGNILKVFASTLEAFLGVLGVEVPAETITIALAHTAVKVVNLAETVDFQTESESFESINSSARRDEVDAAIIASNETAIAPVGIDTFARLEKNYGMDREYYNSLKNLEELPVAQQAKILGKFVKAIVLDEDLQILLLETIIELNNMNLYYNLAKIAKGIYMEDRGEVIGAGSAVGTAALKKVLKKAAKKAVLKELKKTSYYKGLTPAEQDEYEKKVGKGVGAIVTYTFDMSQFVTYVVLAPVPGSRTIYVLDPPGNFTVHAESSNVTVLGGGSVGAGIGNVSLSLGDVDVYRASYVSSTESLPTAALFNGTLLWIRTSVRGRRKGEMLGNVTITMKPTADGAGRLLRALRDESIMGMLLGTYFAEKPLWNVSIAGGVVTITASGILNSLPCEEETEIEIFANANVTLANVTRIGHYGDVIEIRPSFVPLNSTAIHVTGNASVGVLDDVVTVVRGSVKAPELKAFPLTLTAGKRITITAPEECVVEWRLDGRTGRGIFVPTDGLKIGKHTLEATCIAGNFSTSKNFTVEIVEPRITLKKASGTLVKGSGFMVFEFGTDLNMISLVAPEEVEGPIAVSQKLGGEIKGYAVYSTFNVTHPRNWSVENVTLYFRVPKRWFEENNASPENLALLRRSEAWEEYAPVLDYEDVNYLHYHANVPSLSLFAVAVKVTHEEHEIQEETETPTHTESPTETAPAGAPEGGNTAYYVLAALVILALLAYAYRRR